MEAKVELGSKESNLMTLTTSTKGNIEKVDTLLKQFSIASSGLEIIKENGQLQNHHIQSARVQKTKKENINEKSAKSILKSKANREVNLKQKPIPLQKQAQTRVDLLVDSPTSLEIRQPPKPYSEDCPSLLSRKYSVHIKNKPQAFSLHNRMPSNMHKIEKASSVIQKYWRRYANCKKVKASSALDKFKQRRSTFIQANPSGSKTQLNKITLDLTDTKAVHNFNKSSPSKNANRASGSDNQLINHF